MKKRIELAAVRNVLALIIFLLGLMSASYGAQIDCGTNPDLAVASCFANSIVSAAKTTGCSRALGKGDGMDAGVGADCDSKPDSQGRIGCQRIPGSQPYCDIGRPGELVLDMGAAEEIINANSDWDLRIREGGYSERYSVYLSNDRISWLNIGTKCGSATFDIPGQNLGQAYRYIKITAIGDDYCGTKPGYPSDYGAEIDAIFARVIGTPACTNDCSPSGTKKCSGATSYQTCGNYDADSCLDWSSAANCPAGQTCSNGNCIVACVPTTEICNNLDDDCDGSIDEGLTQTGSCGVGACSRSASQTCSAGSWTPSCTPGMPEAEICENLIDDDCDGSIDEADCTAICVPEQEICNNLDDDCDNLVDDENVCCAFDKAEWVVPINCINNNQGIGTGANISLKVEGSPKCAVGFDTVGLFRPSNKIFYLRNSDVGGSIAVDASFSFGMTGDLPIAGDWNGDGSDTIGVYRPSTGQFLLRNSNTPGNVDMTISYGSGSDLPVVGDWNGDGSDTIGVYRPSTGQFLLRNSNTPGNPDITFNFGLAGDLPIAGDWNNDGIDTVGVFRPGPGGIFYFRNSNAAGPVDVQFSFGMTGDLPIAGDWNNDGIDTVGVFRPDINKTGNGGFYLRDSNVAERINASVLAIFGLKGDLPIAGDWDENKKNKENVRIAIFESDTISTDDAILVNPSINKNPFDGWNANWLGIGRELEASWITEYQEDESGTNPEYYFIAELEFEGIENYDQIKSTKIKVKPCSRFEDEDCDGVDDLNDICLGTPECSEVNARGCIGDLEEGCAALWDCSSAQWSECIEGKQTRDTNQCIFTDPSQRDKCSNYFKPIAEKTCLAEEAFPAFGLSSLMITILILAGFYYIKKFKRK